MKFFEIVFKIFSQSDKMNHIDLVRYLKIQL